MTHPDHFIPLSEPVVKGNEWKYVKECLDTGWVSSVGSFVDRFEKEIAAYAETKYAVATVNGTSALHIALLLAGVGPDDEVVTSSLTFIAPANTIRYVGAWPVFIDAEPCYYQMDIDKLIRFLDQECHWKNHQLTNKKTGRRIAALLPVHILGHPVDMDPLLEAAKKYGLPVIEDSTEGLGTLYNGKQIGSLGESGTFSFNGNKIITTGGGGMIVTNNEEWAKKAKYLTTQAKDDSIEFIHGEVGYNYRLTNVLAALGCAQLEQLPDYLEIKKQISKNYEEALKDTPGLTLMPQAPWAKSTYWMYTIRVDEKKYGMNSRSLLKKLALHNVQARPLWQPLHLSRVFKGMGSFDCPVAETLNQECLSLPCSVSLQPSDQNRVIHEIVSS